MQFTTNTDTTTYNSQIIKILPKATELIGETFTLVATFQPTTEGAASFAINVANFVIDCDVTQFVQNDNPVEFTYPIWH